MSVQPPIILIGTQRSGTTWLWKMFGAHPRISAWSEPRHVWTRGNAYKQDDRLTSRDASPRIVRHIREEFARRLAETGKERVAEKTPSNCLRVPFIHAVFPEAKFLLVLRDGRSVLRSTDEVMEKGVPTARIWKRARKVPLWEWPAYAGGALNAVSSRAFKRRLPFWGPRPPGWKRWVREDEPDVIIAKQWAAAVSCAHADILALPPGKALIFRYEDMMGDPVGVVERIAAFAGIPDPAPLSEYACATADPARQDKWRSELDPATLDLIRPHLEPTLRSLGYEW